MPLRPAESHAEPRTAPPTSPRQAERLQRRQRRQRRHALDRVMWTASGTALGAGLVTITVYIMIGDWL